MNAPKILLTLALCLIATIGISQTRKICHRSHSGASTTFALLLGEDHLGATPEMLARGKYDVEPFIMKIRLHYEKLASKNPALRTELPSDPQRIDKSADADSAVGKPSDIPQKDSKEKPRDKKSAKTPIPMALEVPSPDFLVQTQMREQATGKAIHATPTPEKQNGLLWALVMIPIAPALFFASAVAGRKRSV